MKTYDIIVIGSGGGTKIVRPAANLGKKVAVIEKDKLGGTCLNRGCIPSKMLIHPADLVSEVREASKFDIKVDQNVTVDFSKLVSRINTTIDSNSNSIEPMYERHDNIDYYHGEASFLDKKIIVINNKLITAETIFITVGVRPSVPPIEGLTETPYWTSTEALRNTILPKSLIVIGGGYIGVELGYAYSSLGSDVTFLVRNKMINFEDSEIVEEFEKAFAAREHVLFGEVTKKVTYEDNQFILETESKDGQKQILKADKLLITTGITSNADTLKLENTDIDTNEKGFIKVDDFFQTTEPGVYAFGDVIGRYLFRHTVNYEGDYVFNTAVLKKNVGPIKYPPVPHAIFSNPQVGGVGKTEEQLIKEGIPYVKGVNAYKSSAMGMALLSENGFAKVLFNKQTRQLEGVHIIGKESANMIHMAIAFMKMNATIDDMMDTIFIHPAITEILRNAIRKAFTVFEKEQI
jgi:mycothione reductase